MTDMENLFEDRVVFFLVLANADNAFLGITSVEDLWKVRPRDGESIFTFQWQNEVLELPVFRKAQAHGVTEKAWTCASMFRQLSDIIQKAGYRKGTITIHTIRRGMANVADDKLTPGVRNQLLGWSASDTYGKSDSYGKSYISRIPGADGQNLFLDKAPSKSHINLLRSAGRHQNVALPQKMSADALFAFENSLEMRALDARLATKTLDGSERKRIYTEMQNLKQKALLRYQEQWLEDDYIRTVSVGARETPGQPSRPQYEALSNVEHDFDVLRPFMPERSRLADMLYTSASCFDPARKEAVQDLTAICVSKDQRVIYRPNEVRLGGRCPVPDCRKTMNG
ncbi:hypothetical protein OEA41_000256 [Lepraria neglecta]|uniref:Uncharacterized protein n=1 Tax=Lepraria neglecta TaxID=209136 RepID=A0AAE0DR98_9LECA|nr:hypothetical protein OEA41_000256 [Lepraria neglecta]